MTTFRKSHISQVSSDHTFNSQPKCKEKLESRMNNNNSQVRTTATTPLATTLNITEKAVENTPSSNVPKTLNHVDHTTNPVNNSNVRTLFLPNDSVCEKNESWGDTFSTKPVNTVRVYFQNIHGIISQKSWDKWKEIVNMINNYKVDVAGFVETNINWNPTNCNTAKSILLTRNKHVVMTNTHSDDPTTGTYQPGGMSLILQNNIIGAIDSN